MKQMLILMIVTLLSTSCSEEEIINIPSEVESQWLFIETLDFPSGWASVDSELTISFYTDGTFSSNGGICSWGDERVSIDVGTYDLNEMTIDPEDCNSHFTYEFEESNLIIRPGGVFRCREECGFKFKILPQSMKPLPEG